MYQAHFDLTEEPFSIAANPRFLYMSDQHREALAHLLYGIRIDSGFVMLTGEVGTGKTTVCRCLMEQLPEHTNLAFILNPRVTVIELLHSICDEFGISNDDPNQSVKTFVDTINRYLLEQNAQGRKTVVIIDEAQNLSFDVLEQLRLLTNLETNEHKLLRILLLGQPELETILARPELKQLEQRITARFRLQPLARSEIHDYVVHRLAVAGCRKPVFPPALMNQLYAKTRGVPRLINIVCDRAMLGAYVKSRHYVNASILEAAIGEVKGEKLHDGHQPRTVVLGALLLGSLASMVWFHANRADINLWPSQQPKAPPIAAAAAPSPSASPTPFSLTTTIDVPEGQKFEDEKADIPNWPETIDTSGNTLNMAMSELFRQWSLPLTNNIAPTCEQAISSGLRCYSGLGNLGILAKNNRPAILTLLDTKGQGYQVALISLTNHRATLAFADGARQVKIEDLEFHWLGRYQMLWRMSPQGLSIFRPGDRGSGIIWLTKSLRTAGIEPLEVKDHYDFEVFEAVKTFQRHSGLSADGIAGRQTLIHLNSVNDQNVPRLSSQGGN